MTSSKESVKRKFSDRASEWDASYSDPEARSLNMKNLLVRQRFALRLVEPVLPRGSKILDVGCGPGEIAAKLMQRGYEVWGVDIAEPMVRYARERCGVDRFRVGDIDQIPFQDRTFDGVVCLGVLEYLDTDAGAVSEIERVLKPGGLALVSTPSGSCPFYHMDRLVVAARPLLDFLKYRLRGKPVPMRPPIVFRRYYRRTWLRRLRSAGLQPEELMCYGWGWYVTGVGALVERLSRIAELFWRPLERFLGRTVVQRLGERLARNRAFNWLAYEQIVRLRAAK